MAEAAKKSVETCSAGRASLLAQFGYHAFIVKTRQIKSWRAFKGSWHGYDCDQLTKAPATGSINSASSFRGLFTLGIVSNA